MKIKPEFGQCANQILCPSCGSEYLHQIEVTAYFRHAEDSKTGRKTVCSGTEVYASSNASMDGCPGSRRDGLDIVFECESCEGHQVVNLVQDKGLTYLLARKEGSAA